MGELAEYLAREYGKKLREETEPNNGVVYHYTSPEGLKSILENKSLWLGDFRFLNDENEILYATNMLKKLVDIRKLEINECVYTNIVSLCEDPLNYISRGTIIPKLYILSLSTIKDSLNMWNYYSKDNNKAGYSIGIEYNQLKKKVETIRKEKGIGTGKGVGKVIYDITVQERILNKLIDYMIQLFPRKKVFSQSEWEEAFSEFRNPLISLMAYFKTPEFVNESEVRFVILVDEEVAYENYNIRFPVNLGVLSPKLELQGDEILQSIKEIVVGPYNSKELSILGLREFIKYNKLDIDISPSNVKVRF